MESYKRINEIDMKTDMKGIRNKICYTIGILAVIFCLSSSIYMVIDRNRNHTLDIYRQRLELNYYGTKDTLVNAVDGYIRSIAPESCLNGLTLVNECEKHDLDIMFVLAQGKIESHFGTKGIAGKTHSVFNVYSYDGKSADDIRRAGHAYEHPDESVEPYMKLLKKKYLNDGRTEMDLMDKFENSEGQRYATDKNYESKLLSAYRSIDDSTEIGILWEKMLKYKMLAKK